MASGAVKARRGFTLLELLITLSVTTIGLIGLLSLHLSIARGNDGASRAAEAEQITATTLESLHGMRLDKMMQTLTGNPNAVPPVFAAPFTVQGRGGMTYTVSRSVITLASASNSLMRIRVDTTWTEDGAAAGANGGQLDHRIALEVIRTVQEAL
jgi:prepilin-type N-terminal cleavage/methylation domain-containing protein